MSSDAEYMSFLEKANQDTGNQDMKTQSSPHTTLRAVDTDIPGSLVDIDEVLTSETEEPFKPLALKWEKQVLPTEAEFSDLVHLACTQMSTPGFDPQSRYIAVIEAVKAAGNGEVTIFHTDQQKTRIHYFIVSVDQKAHRLVGLHAFSVET